MQFSQSLLLMIAPMFLQVFLSSAAAIPDPRSLDLQSFPEDAVAEPNVNMPAKETKVNDPAKEKAAKASVSIFGALAVLLQEEYSLEEKLEVKSVERPAKTRQENFYVLRPKNKKESARKHFYPSAMNEAGRAAPEENNGWIEASS